MDRINIQASSDYDVLIGTGLIDTCGTHIRECLIRAQKALIVTDPQTVEDIYNALDEHSQLIASALSSRHVADIRDQVEEWDNCSAMEWGTGESPIPKIINTKLKMGTPKTNLGVP